MPEKDSSIDQLRGQARDALGKLKGAFQTEDVDFARSLLDELRNKAEYDGLLAVAEAVGRVDPKDAKARRLYAQGLIETGKVTAAIDVLRSFARRCRWADRIGRNSTSRARASKRFRNLEDIPARDAMKALR